MIGIIGGSGLEDPKLLLKAEEKTIETPYGKHSPLTSGEIDGVKVALLSRHGRKHELSPSSVNYRANIWALKESGCGKIIASTACGSLREEIKPGDFILPSQFIDR
ncbi:MTAP family purine nucleoside phosphorylase, partial [archaeon]|nr:MTAP family purine nucleoside phosphorylase [archaeon]